MVEGDLADLTLPTLLQALRTENATVLLRLQNGPDQGRLYFREGALVHATSGEVVGDEAVLELLGWPDGRFRIVRDAEHQPRTITNRITEVLSNGNQGTASARVSSAGGANDTGGADAQLLHDLLTLLTRLEQDRVRLAETHGEADDVSALLRLGTTVNAVIAFVTARCGDSDARPSCVLAQLAEAHPYTQLLGEEHDRISIATVAGVLKTWNSDPDERRQLFQDLSRALIEVLTWYCRIGGTFFHSSIEREEWRTTFAIFADGLWTAVMQVDAVKRKSVTW